MRNVQATTVAAASLALNNGQYTVFAPTNTAFDKLPASTIDKLKTDSEC